MENLNKENSLNNKEENENENEDIDQTEEINYEENDLLKGISNPKKLNKYFKNLIIKYEEEYNKNNENNENKNNSNLNKTKNQIKFIEEIKSRKNKEENKLKDPNPTNKIFKVFDNYLKTTNLIDEINSNKISFDEISEKEKFLKNLKIKNLTVKEKIELLCLEFYYDYICSTKIQREKILIKKYSILRRDKKKLLKISLQIKLREKENKIYGNKEDSSKGNESPYFNNNINSNKNSKNNFTEEEIKELNLLERRIAYLKNCPAENKNSNSYSFVNNIYKFVFSFNLYSVNYKENNNNNNK